MYIHEYEIRVRYPETDKMGIVYHGNYITFFDMGRTELLRALGYNYRQLEEMGLWLPVLEADCCYRNPARYDDIIKVSTTIEELSRVKIKFGYKITRDDILLSEGFTKHGFTSPSLKPIALNKFYPELFEKLKSCIEQ